MFSNDDTICAPATVPGTGAISIIRVSGADALTIADRLVQVRSSDKAPFSDAKGYTIRFGTITGDDGTPLDEVLVSIFKAPHSYTGENSVEISCHASSYIVSEILRKLNNLGCRNANPGEFTQRAFLNGKMDLAQAEAVADVISSTSAYAHKVAFKQLKGGVSRELSSLREQLLHLMTLLELELDFSEEDVEFADRSQLMSLVDEAIAHITKLSDSFRLGNAIRSGIPVAIAGPANAGKSTLLNTLLGDERAIVSDVPGTTRDTIEETMNVNGLLFRFIDTAGIRESEDKIERIGIERTMKKLAEADVVLAVLDASLPLEQILSDAETVLPQTFGSERQVIAILNKIDGISREIVNNIIVTLKNKFVILSDIKPISAKNGEGVEELKKYLFESQKSKIQGTDQVLITNARHHSALQQALRYLEQLKSGLTTSLPGDLLSEDLRATVAVLSEITGQISSQDVLSRVFRGFCIGK